MTEWRTQRPGDGEYAPFYAGYVAKVADGDILEALAAQRDAAIEAVGALPAAKLDYRYAPGKWTVREMLRHALDAEWVFAYRALWIARGDQAPLPDMDQDRFVTAADVTGLGAGEWIEEFRHLRAATLALYGGFDKAAFARAGTASGHRITVRALVWVTAGHLAHHLGVLRERYL